MAERVLRVVDQGDGEEVADLAPQGRAGDLAVEAPGLLLDPWGDLEDALAGGQGELVLAAAGGGCQPGVVGLPAGRRGGVGVQLGAGVGAVGLVRPGGDLDDLGVDLHLLEHDRDRLRRAERGVLGGCGHRRATGLQLPDPAADMAELDGHDQEGQEHDPDHQAEHELLKAEAGLVVAGAHRLSCDCHWSSRDRPVGLSARALAAGPGFRFATSRPGTQGQRSRDGRDL
jgi:hypothetical protein